MKINDENIPKDQLLTEDAFIRYCNSGYIGDERHLEVSKKFLDAVKKDGFIAPLLSAKKDLTTPKGKVIKRKVDYYSPHQLFLMVGLKRNVVKKVRLSSKEQMAWSVVPVQTVLWGSHFGYNVNAAFQKILGIGHMITRIFIAVLALITILLGVLSVVLQLLALVLLLMVALIYETYNNPKQNN